MFSNIFWYALVNIFHVLSFLHGSGEVFSKSQLINLAPSLAPDIPLFRSNFVSINDANDAYSSLSYSNVSPPRTNLILCGSNLSGI